MVYVLPKMQVIKCQNIINFRFYCLSSTTMKTSGLPFKKLTINKTILKLITFYEYKIRRYNQKSLQISNVHINIVVFL